MNIKLGDRQELAKNPCLTSEKPRPRNLNLLVSQPDTLATTQMVFWQAHFVASPTANPLSLPCPLHPCCQRTWILFSQWIEASWFQGWSAPIPAPGGTSRWVRLFMACLVLFARCLLSQPPLQVGGPTVKFWPVRCKAKFARGFLRRIFLPGLKERERVLSFALSEASCLDT